MSEITPVDVIHALAASRIEDGGGLVILSAERIAQLRNMRIRINRIDEKGATAMLILDENKPK